MLRRYRALGGDLPGSDLRRGHGVAMEGYFWRFSDVGSGRVVVALCGVSRAPDGVWANVALAAHPGGFGRQRDVATAAADRRRLGVWAGERTTLAADANRVRVDLGPDARLDVRIEDRRDWTGRPLGGLGAAHVIPGLSQYWHPHVLGGRASGHAQLGDERVELEGWNVYAEKNWGRGGFPDRWWWGQAQGFQRADVCVAFAGGDVSIGPVTTRATGLVVALGDEIIRLGNPVLAPVHADVGGGRWSLRGRGPRWSVAVRAAAEPSTAHVLCVPLPAERRSVPAAHEHLAGRLELVVRRRGRVAFAGESRVAGLELGEAGQTVAGAKPLSTASTSRSG